MCPLSNKEKEKEKEKESIVGKLMKASTFNGISVEQLRSHIVKEPQVFSVKGEAVWYQGRIIQFKNGKTYISEVIHSQIIDTLLVDRLAENNPSVTALLRFHQSDVVQHVKRLLPAKGYDGIVNTGGIEEKKAIAILLAGELLNDYDAVLPYFQWLLKSFPKESRYQLLRDSQRIYDEPFVRLMEPLALTSVYLLKLLGDTASFKDVYSFEHLNFLPTSATLKQNMDELHKLVQTINPKLSDALKPELQILGDAFSGGINSKGRLLSPTKELFTKQTNTLIYLVSSYYGASEQANFNELASHISKFLYDFSQKSNPVLAKELSFLSKQSKPVNYMNTLEQLSNILKNTIESYKTHKEIPEIGVLGRLNSLMGSKSLSACLDALKDNMSEAIPELSHTLLPEVERLKSSYDDKTFESAPVSSQEYIDSQFQRLMLLTAACMVAKKTRREPHLLTPFLKGIISYNRANREPYLLRGLICLAASSSEIQTQFYQLAHKKSGQPLLAPLSVLPFLNKVEKLSETDWRPVLKNLSRSTLKTTFKDGSTFGRWLEVMNQLVSHPYLKNENIGQMLFYLTADKKELKNKLELFDLEIALPGESPKLFKLASKEEPEPDKGMVSEDPILSIAKNSTALLSSSLDQLDNQWIFAQRHFISLFIYQGIISGNTSLSKAAKDELIELLDCFIKSASADTFVEERQSTENNPHFKAILEVWPELKQGWNACFSGFSDQIKTQLDNKESLQLTEDPWDLFISGQEVDTCQAPNSRLGQNHALMGYVMDGTNVMLAKKNGSGSITARTIIRAVFNDKGQPALFMEKVYTKKATDHSLLMGAANEVSQQMKVPLYFSHMSSGREETLSMQGGRAPFDYFDSLGLIIERQARNITLRGVKQPILNGFQVTTRRQMNEASET